MQQRFWPTGILNEFLLVLLLAEKVQNNLHPPPIFLKFAII